MADLDVTAVLDDPMLVNTFTVLRRSLGVGEDGRASTGTPTEYPGIIGSVQYESSSETQKRDDGQYSPRNLKIFTRFHLYKASENYAPDQIIWGGEIYEILDVQSYANYGAGHYIGIARSIKVMNQP